MTGQYAHQQKILLYVLPVVFAVGGIAFPIGVLIYWTTSNLWTMGQQFYVIRRNPAPGTPAAAAKEQRDAAKRARKGSSGGTAVVEAPTDEPEKPSATPRQQPKKQSRDQRRKQAGSGPAQPRSAAEPGQKKAANQPPNPQKRKNQGNKSGKRRPSA
jgi:YidC/Oxa1 family membrane protein insertase